MRRVGDDGTLYAAHLLARHGHAPCNRAAPVMADNRELFHPQRIGQQEDIADKFVGRVIVHALGLGRAAIAALVGCNAAIPIGEMRNLVAPSPVALGKAVEENENRSFARARVDRVEFDAVGEADACLLHHSACIFSI